MLMSGSMLLTTMLSVLKRVLLPRKMMVLSITMCISVLPTIVELVLFCTKTVYLTNDQVKGDAFNNTSLLSALQITPLCISEGLMHVAA